MKLNLFLVSSFVLFLQSLDMLGEGKRKMLQGEVAVSSLTSLTLLLLLILNECESMVKKDPLGLSVVSLMSKK